MTPRCEPVFTFVTRVEQKHVNFMIPSRALIEYLDMKGENSSDIIVLVIDN